MIDRALRLWPRNSVIWEFAFAVELRVGDPRRAEAMLDAPDRPVADAPRPDREKHRHGDAALLAPHSADPRRDQLPAALRIAQLGHTDAAYRLALGATGDMDEDNDEQLFRAGLSRFRDDPRFMVLAARRGLVHIWQVTGAWPDFCATSHRQGCGSGPGRATRRRRLLKSPLTWPLGRASQARGSIGKRLDP